MDVNQKALELHLKFHGKLEVKSKVPLNTKEDLSLAYTPGVAEVSRKLAEDKENAYKYSIKKNSVAVVSDGSAVLGLGNIGAYGAIPVMEGKAILFKEFADIDAFPICLEKQDVDSIVNTVRNIAPIFGGINLEDIQAPKCFEVEERLMDLGIPVMHDDQHGTAVVILAALLNSCKVTGKSFSDLKIVVNGAGAAGIAVSKLLLDRGVHDLVLCDTSGVIFEGRKENMNPYKEELSKISNRRKIKGSLKDALRWSDVFIGVSAANVLNEDDIKLMDKNAIVLAMANPIPEIMPHNALQAGAKIVGTGRSDFPNQVNNVLAFPGIFRGALDSRAKKITKEMLIAAAEALADYVKEPRADFILPSPLDKGVAIEVANAVGKVK